MIKLIFGTYNIIPAGEDPALYEKYYQKAFKPFITTIYNHQNIKTTLLYSGSLLEWLKKTHPEFCSVLFELTSNKTIELLGCGYWNPMLCLIPAKDRISQIELMTTDLRKMVGRRPRGSWVSGQVWESNLATTFRSSGMEFVLLNDKTIPSIPQTQQPFAVEDQGKSILIFPVTSSIGDRFIKDSPQDILNLIKSYDNSSSDPIVTIFTDGIQIDNKTWLERFLNLIEQSGDWLENINPTPYLRSIDLPQNRVYMSDSGYDYLMSWTTQKNAKNRNLQNVSYRHFLSRYRESGLLYAKMTHVSILTNQIRNDKFRKKNSKEDLWRGQEHFAYWYGPNGGIYKNRLRHYAYNALIEAEKTTRERGIFKSALSSVDFDMDGVPEYLFNGINYNAYVHIMGGSIFELDYLPGARNYLATFARYNESYLPAELNQHNQDSYSPHAFIDHVVPASQRHLGWNHKVRTESSLANRCYHLKKLSRDKTGLTLISTHNLGVAGPQLEIHKTYHFRRNNIELTYSLVNLTSQTLDFRWASEINLALPDNADKRKIFINNDTKATPDQQDDMEFEITETWRVRDDEIGTHMQFYVSQPAHLCRTHVFSDCMMDGRRCHQYQHSMFMPWWDIQIPANNIHEISMSFKINMTGKSD